MTIGPEPVGLSGEGRAVEGNRLLSSQPGPVSGPIPPSEGGAASERIVRPDAEQREKIAARLGLKNRDRSDRGQALPLTRAALELFASETLDANEKETSSEGGRGKAPNESRVEAGLNALVKAISSERVIVPVEFTQTTQGDKEKHGAIEFVRVPTPAGDALAIYSSVQALAHDRPWARPMAYDAFKVCLAALVETGGRIVVDPGLAQIVVPRPAVAALAQHDEWLPAWKDAELVSHLRDLAGAGRNGILDLRISYEGEGLFRVDVLADAAFEQGMLRSSLDSALRRIGSSQRLIAAVDRVELRPRLVRRA